MFLLQDRLKALAGKSAVAIERVHVIGAGVMGGDIAAWCALRGLDVTLQDREQKLIEPALVRATSLFARRLATPAEQAAAGRRLRADVDGNGVAGAECRHRGDLRGLAGQAGAVCGRRTAAVAPAPS